MQRTAYNEKGEEVTEMVSEDEEPEKSAAKADKQVSSIYIGHTALLLEGSRNWPSVYSIYLQNHDGDAIQASLFCAASPEELHRHAMSMCMPIGW